MMLATMLCMVIAGEPWLPDADQARENALWNLTGVPQVDGLRWYKQPRVSQRLTIINDTQSNGIYENKPHPFVEGPNTNNKEIWRVTGGLAHSPKSEWRNATGVYLPGEIEVWRGWTDVKNSFGSYQKNTVMRWRYPEGTVFADLLIRTVQDKIEYPFELRTREKRNGEWVYTAYKPYADESDLPATATKRTWKVPAIDEKIPAKEMDVWELADTEWLRLENNIAFKPSRLALTGAGMPAKYIGHTASCVSCHSRAGESGDYAGVNAPGSDAAISFHPFTMRTVNTDRLPELNPNVPTRTVKK